MEEVTTASQSRISPFDSSGLAVLLVAIVVFLQTLLMGRAVVGLNVALALSLGIWLTRHDLAAPTRVLPVFAGAMVVQLAHLLEEYSTGFHRTFPALFGYVWDDMRFLLFNGVWLVILAASAAAIARGHRLGYLGGFFLAIGAGITNGMGHVALAARAGTYFPGAYTAVLSLAAGSLLLARLVRSPPEPRDAQGDRQP